MDPVRLAEREPQSVGVPQRTNRIHRLEDQAGTDCPVPMNIRTDPWKAVKTIRRHESAKEIT